MSKKHKNTCRNVNFFENSLLFIFAVPCCVTVSGFASLVSIPIGITSSAVELKIQANTAETKKYQSVIKKKKKDHDKIVLLGKTELYAIEALISKVLIKSYISHDVFVSVHNVLREYNEKKKEIKIPENSVKYTI